MIRKRKRMVVLHGVNLDMLGRRSREHYGSLTLRELERAVKSEARRLGWRCLCLHTNHEGTYVEYIHRYRDEAALVVNPGAWTHYSYAIRDALEIVTCPVAEVHLSDISAREDWRKESVIGPLAEVRVAGKGLEGYIEAIRSLTELV